MNQKTKLEQSNAASALDADITFTGGPLAISVATSIIERITKIYKGYNAAIIGPPLAGKTRFFQYLHTLTLMPEDTDPYVIARERTVTPDHEYFTTLKFADQGNLSLSFRSIVDEVGKLSENVGIHKSRLDKHWMPLLSAHVAWVVLDGTKKDQVSRWCAALARSIANDPQKLAKLHRIYFLINKADNVEDMSEVKNRIRKNFIKNFGDEEVATRVVGIYPTILVSDPRADALLTQMLHKVAFDLRKSKPLVKELGG